MKDYKDVARSVFRRRDEYLQEKKRKRDIFMKRTAVALSCCVMVLVGFNIWRNDALRSLAPSPDGSKFNVTEADTTAPTTTDENGMTAPPAGTVPTVTNADAQGGNESDHGNSPVVTTDASGTGNVIATTTRSNSGGGAHVTHPTRTTMSYMEITLTSHTAAVTTVSTAKTSVVKGTATTAKTTAQRTTTAQHTTTAKRPTTTRNTTTTIRITTTHMPTTTSHTPTTARYTTTTSFYIPPGFTTTTPPPENPIKTQVSTTRIHTTTTARPTTTRTTTYPYGATTTAPKTTQSPIKSQVTATHAFTTIRTTSMQHATTTHADNPSPVATSKMADMTTTRSYPEPVATTTAAIATSNMATYTAITGFHYEGKYYRTTGVTVHKSDLGSYVGTEYDPDSGITFTLYKYRVAKELALAAVPDNNDFTYVGVNEVWVPPTVGELLSGLNASENLIAFSYTDNEEGKTYEYEDDKAFLDVLNELRNEKITVEGLSFFGKAAESRRNGTEYPQLDLDSARGYLYVHTICIADITHPLNYGYMLINDDGKLDIELFYLKFTVDLGTERANELINKLKSL